MQDGANSIVSVLLSSKKMVVLINLDSFVCAIAISVARLCYLDSGEFVLHDSWVRCVKILDYYKPRIQSAQRAMDMLYRLDARVTQLTKGLALFNLFLWYIG